MGRSFWLPQHPKARPQLCAASCQHQNKPDPEIQSHSLPDVQSALDYPCGFATDRAAWRGGGGRGDQAEREVKMRNPWGLAIFKPPLAERHVDEWARAAGYQDDLPCARLEIKAFSFLVLVFLSQSLS